MFYLIRCALTKQQLRSYKQRRNLTRLIVEVGVYKTLVQSRNERQRAAQRPSSRWLLHSWLLEYTSSMTGRNLHALRGVNGPPFPIKPHKMRDTDRLRLIASNVESQSFLLLPIPRSYSLLLVKCLFEGKLSIRSTERRVCNPWEAFHGILCTCSRLASVYIERARGDG